MFQTGLAGSEIGTFSFQALIHVTKKCRSGEGYIVQRTYGSFEGHLKEVIGTQTNLLLVLPRS